MRPPTLLTSAVAAFGLMATLFQFASGATIAFDDASQPAYADGWQAGDNDGTGFGPWSFAFSGNGNGLVHPPQFIDNGPLPGNSLGAPAFSLSTGDQPNAYETSEVQRIFVSPLGIGQTLSVDVDGSALDPSAPAFTIGNTLDLFGSVGIERFSLITNNQYNNDHWTVGAGVDTGIPAGSAYHLDFKLVTANSYDLILSPVGGGAPFFTQNGAPLAGTSGATINRLRISDYGTGSSADGSKELFFNNLLVSGPIPGDFNNDNIVDAADYVLWRKNGLDADSYDFWRTHFGQFASASALSAPSFQFLIPEPTCATLALISFAIFPRRFRRVT